MKGLKSIVFVAMWAVTQLLWAQASPVPMLESSANQIIAALKQNKGNLKNNPQII